jgi:hypothetical protein
MLMNLWRWIKAILTFSPDENVFVIKVGDELVDGIILPKERWFYLIDQEVKNGNATLVNTKDHDETERRLNRLFNLPRTKPNDEFLLFELRAVAIAADRIST